MENNNVPRTSSTSNHCASLPDKWVARIFQELQGHYGIKFLNMWKIGQTLPDGQDAGVVNAMRVWGEKLGGFIDKTEAIKVVLTSLPSEPPTLPQFMELCRSAASRIGAARPALDHKLSPEEIDRNRQRAAELAAKLGQKMTAAANGVTIKTA